MSNPNPTPKNGDKQKKLPASKFESAFKKRINREIGANNSNFLIEYFGTTGNATLSWGRYRVNIKGLIENFTVNVSAVLEYHTAEDAYFAHHGFLYVNDNLTKKLASSIRNKIREIFEELDENYEGNRTITASVEVGARLIRE